MLSWPGFAILCIVVMFIALARDWGRKHGQD